MYKTCLASAVLLGPLLCLGCSSENAPVTPGNSASGQNVTSAGGTTTGVGGSTTTSAGPSTTGGMSTTTGAAMTSAATTGDATTTGATTGAATTGSAATTAAGTTGGDSCPAVQSPIERAGQYVLEFGNTYFAAQAAGGKIVEFRRGDGANLFIGATVDATNFGSTVWTAPQTDWGWPPPPPVDSDPYTVTVDEPAGSVTMTSSGAPSMGPNVTVTKVFTANTCAEAVDVSITVSNAGTAAASYSAWQITRVLPGGLSFFPGPEMLLTGDPAKTPLVTQYLDGAHWFDHATNSVHDDKLFAEATPGWVAFTQGSDLFVKAWADVTAHPPQHGEVEIYDGTEYVELEVVGSFGSIAPGAAATLDIRWYVRAMPAGAMRAAGDTTLLSAVNQLVAQ